MRRLLLREWRLLVTIILPFALLPLPLGLGDPVRSLRPAFYSIKPPKFTRIVSWANRSTTKLHSFYSVLYVQQWWCAYVLVLMAVFWVTECIPVAATGMLPPLILPLVGVLTLQECSSNYWKVRLDSRCLQTQRLLHNTVLFQPSNKSKTGNTGSTVHAGRRDGSGTASGEVQPAPPYLPSNHESAGQQNWLEFIIPYIYTVYIYIYIYKHTSIDVDIRVHTSISVIDCIYSSCLRICILTKKFLVLVLIYPNT